MPIPTFDYDDYDDYDLYDSLLFSNRQSRREREAAKRHRRAYARTIPPLIAEQRLGDDEFTTTYTASDNELAMLQNALTTFYHEHVISDVLAPVKGGKEATVYCCRAHPSTGLDLIAAKIYRPRMFRSLRNDAMYKEGREALDERGKAIRDARRHRAILKKTVYGKEVEINSWIEHEWTTLSVLYEAGADVPRPIMRGNNTILMAYLGDVRQPAPTLNGVLLPQDSAARHFQRMLDNVELMLTLNRIHADFSAYNILYWQGELFIIDFPQAVHATSNPNAPFLLHRDIERLCQYFAPYGIEADPRTLADDLWARFRDGLL